MCCVRNSDRLRVNDNPAKPVLASNKGQETMTDEVEEKSEPIHLRMRIRTQKVFWIEAKCTCGADLKNMEPEPVQVAMRNGTVNAKCPECLADVVLRRSTVAEAVEVEQQKAMARRQRNALSVVRS